MEHTIKAKFTALTKLTIAGLISVAVAIWIQWLSGDPVYPKFSPGPVIFIAVAAIVAVGTRWWWTPLIGTLIALLVTSGWFARLAPGILRLTHPGSVGKFAAGIFIGTLLQITALLFTDIAGLAGTIQNFRRMEKVGDSAKVVCHIFGGLFVFMGILAIVTGTRIAKYHNLMQLIWGVLALAASFISSKVDGHFLHWIWHFLSDIGHSCIAVWKPIDEQRLAYRANAATHWRSYLPSRIRLHLS